MTAWIAGAETKGVVFIDSMVPDLQTLLGGVAPGERAFVLDMSAGGLEQIAAILASNNLTDVGSIAIVGHGASGAITLGTTVLNDADLAVHAAVLKAIGAAVKPGGSLNLYSCDTAAGVTGRTFVADLAKAANVQVDAATHQIGKTEAGQDWTLDAFSPVASYTSDGSGSSAAQGHAEPQAAPLLSAASVQPASSKSAQGTTEPSSPFTEAAMQSYSGTLATGGGTSGQLFVNVGSTYNIYSAPGGGAATASFADQSQGLPLGFDTVNGLFFSTINLGDGSGNFDLVMTDTNGNVLAKSAPIANSVDQDNFGPIAVDPANHLVYAYTFTGTGTGSDAQQNQIFKVSYDPTAHTFGSIPYTSVGTTETATQQTTNAQSLINTASDSTFGNGVGDMELDEASQQLFYTTVSTKPYTSDITFPENNGVYFVSTNASNGKQTQITSSTQFPVNGSVVTDIALDTKSRLVYFTTEARTLADSTTAKPDIVGQSGLYVISMDASGATNATQLTVPAGILPQQTQGNYNTATYDAENLSFDPATQSLYIRNNSTITQIGLNTAGTAVTTTKTVVAGGSYENLYFNALPNLTTTATGTMAMQNGAAVNLLSSTPTITDPDSGGYLQSATIQVTQGGTVRAGDKLLINGTSFGANATTYTDTTGAKFNISYSTATDTLNVASLSNAGTGIKTTTAQYSSLLSKLQYQDGYTDNTTGAAPTRTFTYHIDDGAIGDPSGINTTTSTIAIARTPPTIAGGGATAAALQGGTATGNALAGDSDPNGGTLSVAAVQTGGGAQGTVGSPLAGTYGTLTLSANGAYTYAAGNTAALNTAITNAATGSHPIDNYSFTVSSPSGAATEAFKATIDRAPTGTADNVTATELGAPSTGNVLANDTDADGDALTVNAVAYNGTTYAPGTQITAKYGELTLNGNGTYTYTADNAADYLADSPPRTDGFTYTDSDGMGGTSAPTALTFTVTCFVTGTRIRLARGEAQGTKIADVPVEALRVGDIAVTASGEHRPISWIGSRLTHCRRHPRPHEAMPVRVRAHAFGENRPMRDLMVSPGHSLCVDIVGEVLIPAGSLINGTTIVQEDVDHVTYWHVELEGGHDILLAENMPAESYLEMGNRGFFAESGVVALDASPDAPVATHADFCRPFHGEGALVEVVRAQLAARATRLGWRLEADALGGMHLLVDGQRVEPRVRGLSARFTVPGGAQSVWLVSGTNSAAHIATSSDARALGLCVSALTFDDGFCAPRGVAVDDPRLCVGFHEIERDGDAAWRWTAGRALLPASLWESLDEGFLRVDLAGPALPRWVAPAAAADGATGVKVFLSLVA